MLTVVQQAEISTASASASHVLASCSWGSSTAVDERGMPVIDTPASCATASQCSCSSTYVNTLKTQRVRVHQHVAVAMCTLCRVLSGCGALLWEADQASRDAREGDGVWL